MAANAKAGFYKDFNWGIENHFKRKNKTKHEIVRHTIFNF